MVMPCSRLTAGQCAQAARHAEVTQQKSASRAFFAGPQQVFAAARNGCNRRVKQVLREIRRHRPAQAAFAYGDIDHAFTLNMRQQTQACRFNFGKFRHG